MRILGIDPGLAITGYAVVDFDGGDFNVRDYGVIRTEKGLSVAERIAEIYDGMTELIETYRPQQASVESLFFYNNQKTAMKVGQARGVVILACQKNNISLVEFTPKQVKQLVVGYGVADKNQVQYMIKNIFALAEVPQPDDAADALGLCYACSVAGVGEI